MLMLVELTMRKTKSAVTKHTGANVFGSFVFLIESFVLSVQYVADASASHQHILLHIRVESKLHEIINEKQKNVILTSAALL